MLATLELVQDIRVHPIIKPPTLNANRVGIIRSVSPGFVEIVLVNSRSDERGITVNDLVASVIWPVEAMIESRQELAIAFRRFFRDEISH